MAPLMMLRRKEREEITRTDFARVSVTGMVSLFSGER
jgi:hypothetical protein